MSLTEKQIRNAWQVRTVLVCDPAELLCSKESLLLLLLLLLLIN